MPRYRRVNTDGQSYYKTETRTSAAALLPGTFVDIDADKFVQLAAAQKRSYVVGNGESQGLGILDAIPAGDSVVGNYVESGRTMAIRVGAGTYVKDTPITIGTDGKGLIGDEDSAIGFSQDTVVLTEDNFIQVRFI